MNWWDIWPVINTIVIVIAVPVMSGIKKLRERDLDELNERFKEMNQRIDKLENRVSRHHENHPPATMGYRKASNDNE